MAEVAEARVCVSCSKPVPEGDPLLFWRRIGGWLRYRWSCGHAPSHECPDCYVKANREKTFLSCPQCGCQEEYC